MKILEEKTLLACLDLLENGATIDQVLARFPDSADALHPFLLTAECLAKIAPQPTLAAKLSSQQQFLQQAAEIQALSNPSSTWLRLRRILKPAISSLMVLVILGAALIATPTNAMPGDRQFAAKRLWAAHRLPRITTDELPEAITKQPTGRNFKKRYQPTSYRNE